ISSCIPSQSQRSTAQIRPSGSRTATNARPWKEIVTCSTGTRTGRGGSAVSSHAGAPSGSCPSLVAIGTPAPSLHLPRGLPSSQSPTEDLRRPVARYVHAARGLVSVIPAHCHVSEASIYLPSKYLMIVFVKKP